MKLINVFKHALSGLYASLKRFPVSMFFSILTTILFIMLVHNDSSLNASDREMLTRIAMATALGIPISLCITLLCERMKKTNAMTLSFSYLAGTLVLFLYYLFLLDNLRMMPVTRYIAISMALYLAFLFIPYLGRQYGFELYIIKIFTRFIITVIYSAVLFAGISAILFTIDKLLGIPVNNKLYIDIWLAVAGIFSPAFFLAGIPEYDYTPAHIDYPKLLEILLLYIVMPIISVYTAILYVYFAKIIITAKWPEGLVAHLVLWYSVISLAVVFLISPLINSNRWVKAFIFWLSKLILPLIILMFISIGIRVKAYGVTENRYFVILLGIWAFSMMTYLSIKGPRKNIIMPVFLALLAVLSVVGPWSSYSVSKFSQNMRLESILTKYGMIENGIIVKPKSEVADTDKHEILQILQYFNRSHSLSDVRHLPSGFKMENMDNVFGFSMSPRMDANPLYFSYYNRLLDNLIFIKGYEYLFIIRNYGNTPIHVNDRLKVEYDNETCSIKIYLDNNEIYKGSMINMINNICMKYGYVENSGISPEDMTLEDENENVSVKYIIQDINGRISKPDDKLDIHLLEFYMLLDLK